MRAFLVLKRRLKCTYQQSKLFCTLASRLNKEWEAVIGLEIHAQILSKSKLFSGAATQYGAPTNNQVAYLDAALPGTLPVINKQCVRAAVLTALALKSKINLVSRFDRKHYFYADLPTGYQITQQQQPIAVGGHVDYAAWVHNGEERWMEQRRARITQIQLEQDSGKSLHDHEASVSLIDLNRAGVGLMEIVTEPDFRTADEAAGFVRELQQIVSKLGTCDGRMQESSLRVDASISLHHPGDPYGTRTEVKNISSSRFVALAIEYEIKRQIEILESGGEIMNETRNFDFEIGGTVAMRDKEKLHDYRFMPEPNLPPLRVYTNDTLPQGVEPSQIINVDRLREEVGELPNDVRKRLCDQYGILLEKTTILMLEDGFLEIFELAAQKYPDTVEAIILLLEELLKFFNRQKMALLNSGISQEQLLDLFGLYIGKQITLHIYIKIIDTIIKGSDKSVLEIVKNNDWILITDEAVLNELCVTFVDRNEKYVKNFIRYQKNPKKREKVVMNFVRVLNSENNEKLDAEQLATIIRKLLEKHL